MSPFYDDNGLEIDPNEIKRPSLCVICKKDNDPAEEIICTLTRIDQKDEEEFVCYSFEKI